MFVRPRADLEEYSEYLGGWHTGSAEQSYSVSLSDEEQWAYNQCVKEKEARRIPIGFAPSEEGCDEDD